MNSLCVRCGAAIYSPKISTQLDLIQVDYVHILCIAEVWLFLVYWFCNFLTARFYLLFNVVTNKSVCYKKIYLVAWSTDLLQRIKQEICVKHWQRIPIQNIILGLCQQWRNKGSYSTFSTRHKDRVSLWDYSSKQAVKVLKQFEVVYLCGV